MNFTNKVKEELGIDLEFKEAVLVKQNLAVPSGMLQLIKLSCQTNGSYSLNDFRTFHESVNFIEFEGNEKQLPCVKKIDGEVYLIKQDQKLFDLLKDYKEGKSNNK